MYNRIENFYKGLGRGNAVAAEKATLYNSDMALNKEWSGHPDPNDPDNFWIDDATGERVDARTGERS